VSRASEKLFVENLPPRAIHFLNETRKNRMNKIFDRIYRMLNSSKISVSFESCSS